MIIQYEPVQVRIVRQFQRLGVTQANPGAYVQQYGGQLLDAGTLLQQARSAGVVEDIVSTRASPHRSTCSERSSSHHPLEALAMASALQAMAKTSVATVLATVLVSVDTMLALPVVPHRTSRRATRQEATVMLATVVPSFTVVLVDSVVDSNRRHPHTNPARTVVVQLVELMLLVLLSAVLTATTTVALIATNSTASTNKVYKHPMSKQEFPTIIPPLQLSLLFL